MKKKMILIICLLLGICSIFIGTFAYYKIVVNSNINASIGNVVFNLKDSNNNELNNKTISLNNGNEIFPGDSGSFTITLDASGSSVDLYSTLIVEKRNLPTNLKFYTTSDHRSELHKYYSFLEKNKTNKETLTIYWYWNPYIDDIEDSKFINKSNLEATINVDAVQISKYATMKNGYSSDENMNGGTEFWNNDYKSYIRTIVFDNDLSNLPSSCTEDNLCFDITEDGSYEKVYGYLIDSGLKDNDDNTKSLYNLYIVSKSLIFAPTNCNDLFSNFYNLTSIDFNNNFNTSNATNMFGMFYRCRKLENLDLSSFNTSNVTNMSYMFSDCNSLSTEITIMNSNITNYTNMFTGSAINENSEIVINYIVDTSTIVDNMILTKSSNSTVIKGKKM